MFWVIEGKDFRKDPSAGVAFSPSDVQLLGRLSTDLPWLSGLDPYRDRSLRGNDVSNACADFEVVLNRYEKEFIETILRKKGISAENLDVKKRITMAAQDQFKKDPFYATIIKIIDMLKKVDKGGTILVQGT